MPFMMIQTDREVFRFVRCSYWFRDEYWTDMTTSLLEELKSQDLEISSNTEFCLRFNYDFLCSKFDEIIDKNRNVGFLIFAFTNYDVLCKLYIAQVGGLVIDDDNFDRNDLAVERRAYRVIIEQFVRKSVLSVKDTIVDIQENGLKYLEALERLIYLGVQIFLMGNYISKNRHVPGALTANIDDDGFMPKQKKVYADIYHSITNNMLKHGDSVKIPMYFEELTDNLSKYFGIEYSGALGYLVGDESPKSVYGYTKLNLAIDHLVNNHGYERGGLVRFYKGLTLNKENSLSTNMSFFKSQDNQRFLFRPIVEFEMNGELYHKTSLEKISESIVSLMANCIPFDASPSEWLENETYKAYSYIVQQRNDKVLEDPAFKMIRAIVPTTDQSVKSLLTGNNNIPIDNEECGQIDILCIDPTNKRIIVCECKNNRQRTDDISWSKDTYRFQRSYEKKLDRKVKWVEDHKQEVANHISIKTNVNLSGEKFHEYEVHGLFIINTPTIYLYDGLFRVVTLYTLSEYINGTFIDTVFKIADELGVEHEIHYPYFHNVKKII